jgi:hypothetical protein
MGGVWVADSQAVPQSALRGAGWHCSSNGGEAESQSHDAKGEGWPAPIRRSVEKAIELYLGIEQAARQRGVRLQLK